MCVVPLPLKTSSAAAIAAGVGVVAISVALFLVAPSLSVPTRDGESSLTLVPLLTQKPDQIAEQIVEAAGDEIVSLRLNDTDNLKVVAYTTVKGDIILPIDGFDGGYSRIEYWLWTPAARPLADSDAVGNGSRIWKTNAMNFTKAFLERIGYKLDGSEHYFAEPGGISTITVYQTVSGCEGSLQTYGPVGDKCIIANQPTRLHFKNDGGWMELRKWYEDVHQKEIKVTEEEAIRIAKNYIENERKQAPEKFETYGELIFNDVSPLALMQTFKDNLVYAVKVSYLTDKEYHCAPYLNFDVFVSVDDGKVLGWNPSICE